MSENQGLLEDARVWLQRAEAALQARTGAAHAWRLLTDEGDTNFARLLAAIGEPQLPTGTGYSPVEKGMYFQVDLVAAEKLLGRRQVNSEPAADSGLTWAWAQVGATAALALDPRASSVEVERCLHGLSAVVLHLNSIQDRLQQRASATVAAKASSEVRRRKSLKMRVLLAVQSLKKEGLAPTFTLVLGNLKQQKGVTAVTKTTVHIDHAETDTVKPKTYKISSVRNILSKIKKNQ